MRLIDGNKIVMSLADWWYSSFGQEETDESKAIKKVMDQVEKMVIEMLEIVHCKDCIHCADDWNGNEPMFTCELARCCESVYPNDYCSYGEKQVTGKLESVEKATSEGDESTMGQPKSKLYIPLNQYTVERINRLHKNDCGDYFDEEWLYNELEQIAEKVQLSPETSTNTPTDLISRQAAIEAIEERFFAGTVADINPSWRLLHEIIENLPSVEPKPDLVNRSDVLELAKSGVLIRNDNYKKVCEAINGLPSCHTCRECEPVEPKIYGNEHGRLIDADRLLQETFTVDEEEWTTPEIRTILKNAPPVESERPKGKWKIKECDSIYGKKYILTCPECGESVSVTKEALPHENFCRECGADMRGEEECG